MNQRTWPLSAFYLLFVTKLGVPDCKARPVPFSTDIRVSHCSCDINTTPDRVMQVKARMHTTAAEGTSGN